MLPRSFQDLHNPNELSRYDEYLDTIIGGDGSGTSTKNDILASNSLDAKTYGKTFGESSTVPQTEINEEDVVNIVKCDKIG